MRWIPERRLVGATPRGPLSLPPGGAHWYALGGIGTPEAATFDAELRGGNGVAGRFSGGARSRARPAGARRVLAGRRDDVLARAWAAGGRGRRRSPCSARSFPTVEGFELDLSPPLPPIAIGHGTLDPVIGVEWGRQAREVLEAAGAEVLYRETPMYHQIDPDFVLEVASWLRRVIPPRG